MGRYVVRRLLQGLLTLFFTLFIVHYLLAISIQVRGNPAAAFFGENRVPTQRQLDIVAEKFGTDDPCFEQLGNPCFSVFGSRMADLARWDLGVDYNFRPVNDLLALALPNTLRLFAVTTVVWIALGIGLGILAALRREKFADHAIRAGTVIMTAFPVFLIGVLLQRLLGVQFGNWVRDNLPEEHFLGYVFRPTYTLEHPWLSILVPGIIVGLLGVAGLARLMRTSLLESLRSDHVRTGHAKGLKPRRVVVVHAVRNSLIPIVTAIGLQFGGALAGAAVTETIFNIQGVGRLLLTSAVRNEMSIIIPIVTVVIIAYIVVNLIVDLTYAALDPRIRYV
ncbi:MAG: ABC transporter permease [Stackebrandtia sp.]